VTTVGYTLGLGAERPEESPAKLVELCPLLAYIGQPSGGGPNNRQPVLQAQNVLGQLDDFL
jgi:hypothetical protein